MSVAPPHSLADLKKTFGDIAVKDGQVTTPGWESANMISVKAGWLPRGKLYVNRNIWSAMESGFEACLAIGGFEIKTLGCFAPRAKRVNGDLSTHSWGIAFDLNADDNPLAPKPGAPLVTTIPAQWVAEFQKCGFTWGGHFRRPDPMHFQFVSGY